MNLLAVTEKQLVGHAELARQLAQLSQNFQQCTEGTTFLSHEAFDLFSQISQIVDKLEQYFTNTASNSLENDEAIWCPISHGLKLTTKKLETTNDLLIKKLRKDYSKCKKGSIYDSKLHLTGILQHLRTETNQDTSVFWMKLEHKISHKQIKESLEISPWNYNYKVTERLLADAEELNKTKELRHLPSNGQTLPLPTRVEDSKIYWSALVGSDNDNSIKKNKWVIYPDAPAKVFFDLFVGILVLFSVVTIPIDLAFNAFEGHGFQILEWIIDSVFFVDIALTFFTARVEGSDLIHSRKVIAKKYALGMLVPDVLSSIPYDLLVGSALSSAGNASVRMVRLLRVVRILRLLKFSRLLQLGSKFQTVDMSSSFHVDPALETLCFRMGSILFFAHLMACLWYSINSCKQEQEDWVRCGNDRSISSKYLASLYFIIQTMMTVGYGDIAVNMTAQRAFAITVQISGTLCVGVIVSSIEEVMDSLDPHGKYLSKRLQSVTQYMADKKLPDILRIKLQTHFTYFYNNTSVFPEQKIASALPHHVLETLILSQNKIITQEVVFFKRCLDAGHRSFVIAVLPLLKPMLAQTGEIILRQGDPPEDLYFLKNGEVHGFVVDQSDAPVLMGIFREGSALNLANVICYREMHCMLRTVCQSDIAWMHLEDFEAVLEMFPTVFPLVTEMALAETNSTKQVMDCKSILHGDLRVTEKVLCKSNNIPDEEVLEFSKVKMKSDVGSQKTSEMIRVLRYGIRHKHRMTKFEQKLQVSSKTSGQWKLVEDTTSLMDLKQKWLILPHCPQKHNWDLSILVLTMYSLICIPVSVGFSIKNDGLYAFDLLVDCCYMIDIILTFRTMYEVSPGLFLIEPSLLALYYLKTWFFIDFASAFPTAALTILSNKQSVISTRLVRIARFFRCLKLMRIFKVSWIVKMLGFENRLGASSYYLKQLILLASLLLYVGHFFGCFWAFIVLQEGIEKSWMVYVSAGKGDVANANLANQYAAAVYWAFTTITTVGYGDIKPTNETERGYAVVTMLIGAALFSFIVGNVSHLAGLLTLQKKIRTTHAVEINEFVKEQQLEFALATSIKKHSIFGFSAETAKLESEIMRRLPSSLRREVLWHSSQNIRKTIPFFSSSSDSFISLVVPRLTPQFNEAGTEIYTPTSGSLGLYIVLQGIVEEIKHSLSGDNSQNELLCCIGAGAIFGYRNFLNMVDDAVFSAKASDLYDCHLYVLQKIDLDCLDKKFQQVGEILRDTIHKYVEIQSAEEVTKNNSEISVSV